MIDEIPTFSWFDETGGGNQRVSIYADGTVEIQHGDASFRAIPAQWALSALATNAAVTK